MALQRHQSQELIPTTIYSVNLEDAPFMYGRTISGSDFRLARSDPIIKPKAAMQQPSEVALHSGFFVFGRVAKWLRQRASNPSFRGSNPRPASWGRQVGRRAL